MLENPGFSMFFRFCILPKTCLGDIFQEVHIKMYIFIVPSAKKTEKPLLVFTKNSGSTILF